MRKYKSPPFIMIRRDLLKAPEWRALSSSAKVIYIYLRSKFNHRTLSEVTLSYKEIKDLMAAETASNAFKELIDRGFIQKTKQGGLHGVVTTYKFVGNYGEFLYHGVKV